MTMVRLFESASPSGGKHWAIEVNPKGVTCRVYFGKIGSTLQCREIPLPKKDQKIQEKIRKGYKEKSGSWEIVGFAVWAVNQSQPSTQTPTPPETAKPKQETRDDFYQDFEVLDSELVLI